MHSVAKVFFSSVIVYISVQESRASPVALPSAGLWWRNALLIIVRRAKSVKIETRVVDAASYDFDA
jgi:hypothetical protein